MTAWANIFWLIVAFAVLLSLNRWISSHVQGTGLLLTGSQTTAMWLYFFLFLPGIFLHELSHYVLAVLLRVNAGKFSLWPKPKANGELVLGSVTLVGKIDPLRHSLIGAAPLFVGCAAVALLGRYLQFDILGEAVAGGNVETAFSAAMQSLATPDFWLWLYLLFAIANAMLPSPSDRVYWGPVLLFFGVVAAAAFGFGVIPAIPEWLQTGTLNIITFMASALLIAVAVDLFFVLFIFLLEALIGITTGKRIQYR